MKLNEKSARYLGETLPSRERLSSEKSERNPVLLDCEKRDGAKCKKKGKEGWGPSEDLTPIVG